MKNQKTYNGWSNRETWNVALWISNDPWLYDMAIQYTDHARKQGERIEYKEFLKFCEIETGEETPDGVGFKSTNVKREEIRQMLLELQ